MVTTADGFAEHEAAKAMLNDARQAADNPQAKITLGADKGFDAKEFIDALQPMNVIPHVSQNTSGRHSAVPDAIAAMPTTPYWCKRENSSSKALAGPRPWAVFAR